MYLALYDLFMKHYYDPICFYSQRIILLFSLLTYRFANALVYYGVSYSSVDLGGNRYLNFALISLVELPSNLLCIVAVNKYCIIKPLFKWLVLILFIEIHMCFTAHNMQSIVN